MKIEKKPVSSFVSIIAAIIGLIGTVVTAYVGYRANIEGAVFLVVEATQTAEAKLTALSQETLTSFPAQSQTPTITPTPHLGTRTNTPVPQNLNTQVALLQNQVATLESMVTQQASNNNYASEIKSINDNQKALDQRLSVIEKVVLDSPQKSLELTFMRNEIDELKASSKSDSERTLKEIERVYSQNNWFIGLMFTMAIGLTSLAIGNFVKKPDENKVSNENKPTDSQPKSRSK